MYRPQNISKYPELKILYAIRYGERRWDLILENDIKIKMPESNFIDALDYLHTLLLSNKLSSQSTIDLRDHKKHYIYH